MPIAKNVQGSSLAVGPLSDENALPLLVEPVINNNDWLSSESDIKQIVETQLEQFGGVLFRGFDNTNEAGFRAFARSFGHELLNYDYASTPRTEVDGGVYTSTEYPAHQIIPLHNEQAYTLQWPMKIWFCCITPSAEGGQTPIADSRQVYQKIDADVRQRFEQKKLMYVRNYGNGLDLPWEKAFSTDNRDEVEAFCKKNSIDFEWKDDGELRTKQVCHATAQHPRTKEFVWFNQAHLFHVSNLDPQLKETLVSIVGEQNLPRNVYHGDGSPIDESDLSHIRSVLDDCQIQFPWQKGDILMLDNMLSAHGRCSFSGERKVIVAMAESNT